jgi:alkanesulfonate monooxygenase SsuD/methylene tetrahydromethanopterin reductase-like flavin-dependent oxidoreductase (luciferase family)
VKVGIVYNTGSYGVDPRTVIAVARHAESCGFESFYVPEHIVLYPGARVGPFEFPPALPVAAPLELLSFVAAATERILLGTAVLLLTVGLGSLPGEAEAVGVDFPARGRRADEAIDVLRLLWAGGEDGVSFDGEFFRFTNLCSFPKPCGAGTLPIHVGGASRPAARRAGQRGDGYFPGGQLTAAERASQLDLMRSAATQAGRDPAALEYTRWVPASISAADAGAHAALGATRLVAALSSPDLDGQREEMSALAGRLSLG